jgi:hypothetical protein
VNPVVSFLLFIISPFISFLSSLLKPTSKTSFVIYFMFGVLFCWHMGAVQGNQYDDYFSIVERFQDSIYTLTDFWNILCDFVTFQTNEKEVYPILLNAVTRLFSDNSHLYFAIASIPYLLLSLSCVRILVKDKNFPQQGIWALLIIFLFIIPRDILTVQNPRYTTAFWLVNFVLLKYYDRATKNRAHYLLLLLLTPLIHSGIVPMVLIFIFYLCLPQKYGFIKKLFYISIPFSFFSYSLLSQLNYSFLPANLSLYVEAHVDEDYYNKYVAHTGSSGFFGVQNLFDNLLYWGYVVITFLMIKWGAHKDYWYGKMFQTLLLLFSLSNFVRFIPVIGDRYIWTVQSLVVFLLCKIFYPQKKRVFVFILFLWSFHIFMRWFYRGAGTLLVNGNIYYDNLYTLITDYL